jgi:hypothetical protein
MPHDRSCIHVGSSMSRVVVVAATDLGRLCMCMCRDCVCTYVTNLHGAHQRQFMHLGKAGGMGFRLLVNSIAFKQVLQAKA